MVTCVICSKYFRTNQFYTDTSACQDCSKSNAYGYSDDDDVEEIHNLLHPNNKTEAHYVDE